MAKPKTNAVNKKTVSGKKKKFSLKNLDFKKNWKKLSYLGLAGFLAVSSVGYGGVSYLQQRSASAFGGTSMPLVPSWPLSSVVGCRKTYPTGFGLMHEVTVTARRIARTNSTANHLVLQAFPQNSGQLLRTQRGNFNLSGFATAKIFVSAQLNERMQILVPGTSDGRAVEYAIWPAGQPNGFSPYALAVCQS